MDRTTQPHIFLSEIKRLPSIRTLYLNNGVKMYLIDIENSEMVRLDLMFKGGMWVQDRPIQALLALGNMKEGAAGKSAEQINELIDYHGAALSTTVAKTFAALTVTCLHKHLKNVADIIKDVVSDPKYDEEVMRVKVQQMRTSHEIQAQRVKTQAEWLFFNEMFGKSHPMASFPEIRDFNDANTDMIKVYYDRFLGHKNCTILLSGKINDSTIQIVEQAFGNTEWGGNCLRDDVDELMKKHDFIFDNAKHGLTRFEMPQKTVQSNIMSGLVLNKMTGKDKAVMMITNCLLGGFFGSRLMKNIREKKGLTYGIYSYILANHLFNVLCISTDTTNEMTDLVIEEINKELDKLGRGTVDENELDIVKNYFAGTICRAYEASLAYPARIMKLIATNEKIDEVMELQRFYAEIKPKDITDFASKFLDKERVLWAVAGSAN